jgi:branched-chain amino acid transport system permease protein
MEQVINAIVLGGIYCVFALGLSLTWGTLNVLNLAHGAVFTFCAFACYVVTQRLHYDWPLWLLLILAIVVGALLEVLMDLLVFRPIKRRSKTIAEAEMSMLIGSIGASVILITIVQKVTSGALFDITATPINATVYHLTKSVYVTSLEITVTVVSFILVIAVAFWIQKSRTGRAMRALAFDPETSGLMGISEGRMSTLSFAISGATAGVAGALLTAYFGSITPQSGDDLLLKAFAAVVLGGVGNMWGTIFGALVLASGETYVTATTSGLWTDAVSFGLIVLILLVRPNGLFGKIKGQRA